MPVTYIDLRAGRQREDANRRPRAGLPATSSASANRAGEKVVEVRAGIEALVAQVTVDAAVDDAHHGGHLGDIAADQFRQMALAYRREVMPQRAQAHPAGRTRLRHAECAIERTARVRNALQIRDAVAGEERGCLRLGV